MNGGSGNPALFFMASSLDEVITSTEFLSSAASDERDIAGDLAALQGELGVLQGQLVVLEQDLAGRGGRTPRSQGRSRAGDAGRSGRLGEALRSSAPPSKSSIEIEVARAAAARGGGAGGVSSGRDSRIQMSRSPVRLSPTRGAAPAREGGPTRAPT